MVTSLFTFIVTLRHWPIDLLGTYSPQLQTDEDEGSGLSRMNYKGICRQIRIGVLVSGLVLGSLGLFYPFLSGMAQKGPTRNTWVDPRVLQGVRENPVANSFYDTLQRHEPDWILTYYNYYRGGLGSDRQDGPSIHLVFQKGNANITVIITELLSEERAARVLQSPISSGMIKRCLLNECGDEGRKVYDVDGAFNNLIFRKGHFFVYIACKSEELAKRCAGYAIDAISSK